MASKNKGGDYDSEEEKRRWRKWGKRFGGRMREFGEEFAERAEFWGNRFADRMDEKLSGEGGKMGGGEAHRVKGEWSDAGWHRRWQEHRQRRWSGWWMWPFGLIGPLVGAVFSIVFIVVALWVMRFVNAGIQSGFVSLMVGAVASTIWVFFAFALVMGYLDYLTKRSPMAYMVLWPVSNSLGITFFAWIASWVLRTIGELSSVAVLSQAGGVLRQNLLPVFIAFAAIGYISLWMVRRGQ